MNNTTAAGQVVKFKNPETPAEATERFRVVEVRGDRVLVSPVKSEMRIKPTFVYLTADLETENTMDERLQQPYVYPGPTATHCLCGKRLQGKYRGVETQGKCAACTKASK